MKTLIFANFQILQTVEYLIEILIFVVRFSLTPRTEGEAFLRSLENETF